MKLKKYSLFIMKTIIAIIFLLILFYFMSVLIVGEKKTLNNDFAKSFKDDKGIYISQVFDNYKIFLNENYVKDNKNLLFYSLPLMTKSLVCALWNFALITVWRVMHNHELASGL